jgi:hypothetical protein
MLLGLGAYGTVINNGAASYRVRSLVDRDRGIHKVAIRIAVAHALFGKLTGRAGNAVVMALDACRRVENRTQPGACIMSPFKLCLIESESVAGRLFNPITDAL